MGVGTLISGLNPGARDSIEYILVDRRMNQWFQIQVAVDVPEVPADLLLLSNIS